MAPSIETLQRFEPETSYYSQGIRAKHRLSEVRKPVKSSLPPLVGDIEYHPSFQQYLGRNAVDVAQGASKGDLPQGWPSFLTGPLAWYPSHFVDETEFVHALSDIDKVEIHQALEHFKALKVPFSNAGRDTFPLPTLGERLEKLQGRIYDGPGIVIVRGMNTDAYGDVDAATIFLGVSSYIAERRGRQDRRGSMISHVLSRYKGDGNDDKNKSEMPFHTDVVCDVLALLTRTCSETGGKGTVASSWTVYNELAATRPDLVRALAEPNWPLDTFGRNPPYHMQALLFHEDDKLIMSASRRLLTGSKETPRTEGIPGLTELQAEALDAMHFVAKANSIKLSMKKGDMRFLNNLALIHAREAFEDSAVTQRHLLRLWLSNGERLWKLPPALQLAWDRVFEDNDRPSVWDHSPVKIDGALFNPAESCD